MLPRIGPVSAPLPVKSRQTTRFSGIYELSHNASDGFLRTLQRAEEAEPKPTTLFQWLGRLRGKQARQQKRLGLVYSVLADGMQAQLNDQAPWVDSRPPYLDQLEVAATAEDEMRHDIELIRQGYVKLMVVPANQAVDDDEARLFLLTDTRRNAQTGQCPDADHPKNHAIQYNRYRELWQDWAIEPDYSSAFFGIEAGDNRRMPRYREWLLDFLSQQIDAGAEVVALQDAYLGHFGQAPPDPPTPPSPRSGSGGPSSGPSSGPFGGAGGSSPWSFLQPS